MYAVLVLGLLSTAFSAVIDPSLTEWRLVKQDLERIMFPLRDYILEVKAFRPDTYNTNPPYSELFRTDKSTTMMIMLHSGTYKSHVGRLVWNTIKYDRGYDIAIEECNVRYQAYNSWPANKEKEQIWAWNFFDDRVELTCNGDLQYEQNFDEGEFSPYKPGLPEKCLALGSQEVDRLTLKHMAGEYIRARPKEGVVEPEEPASSSAPSGGPDDIVFATTPVPTEKTEKPTTEEPTSDDDGERYPTCNCWTRECGFCSKSACTVKQDLYNSEQGVTVTSHVKWVKLNSIMLFDEDGNSLGIFQWNLKRISLSGNCIACNSPSAIKKLGRGTEQTWTFSMKDGNVQIKVGGKVLYEQELMGRCRDIYSKVASFSFVDMSCQNSFSLTDEMQAGDQVVPDCGGTCPRE